MDRKKKITVNCPRCEEQFEYYSSESRPFCSQECKQRDLGAWLVGEYAVAGEAAPISEDDDENYTH